ncbi:hypothetical protein [Streptomyces yokosukanensis]|nr:hypothetical protein [Streptomyces yokosukanensis]
MINRGRTRSRTGSQQQDHDLQLEYYPQGWNAGMVDGLRPARAPRQVW